MDALQPLLNDKTADDLAFTALRGGPVRLNNFRRRISSAAAARIGVPDLVPHDLRDTAASLAISSRASIKAVQRMLGHASAKMTLDVYGSRNATAASNAVTGNVCPVSQSATSRRSYCRPATKEDF